MPLEATSKEPKILYTINSWTWRPSLVWSILPEAVPSASVGARHRRLANHCWQSLNIANQEGLLIQELVIFGPVVQKGWQEAKETLSILPKDFRNSFGFFGIRHEDLHAINYVQKRIIV